MVLPHADTELFSSVRPPNAGPVSHRAASCSTVLSLSGVNVSQVGISGPVISQLSADEGYTVWLALDRDLCRPIQSGADAHVCK